MHKSSSKRRVSVEYPLASPKGVGFLADLDFQGIVFLEKGTKDDAGTNRECASPEVSHSSHGCGSCLGGRACCAASPSGSSASGRRGRGGSRANCSSSEVCGIDMATVGLLGRGASCLSSSTVDLIDGSGIADLEFLLADEGWHCLRIELETRCGVVGGAEAIKLQSFLFSCGQRLMQLIVKVTERLKALPRRSCSRWSSCHRGPCRC